MNSEKQKINWEIHNFCSRLEAAWRRLPEMRFGQFLECVRADMELHGVDMFYIENPMASRWIENISIRMAEKRYKR